MPVPTIQDVIDYIQQTVMVAVESIDGVDTLRGHPDEPPEKVEVYPYSIAFIRSANWETGPAGVLKGNPVTIALFIVTARKDLPRDTQKVMPFSVAVPREIWEDPTLGGNVSTVQAVRQVRFGAIDWDTTKFGFEFEIDVKFETAMTY